MEPSPFRESPLSPSEVANYLRDELKRLRKRRQIVTSDSATVTAAGAPRSPPASPGSPNLWLKANTNNKATMFIKNNY